jgi:hypothetical protein
MSPFWRRKVFTLFSAALIRGRRSLKKINLKCGAYSGAALNRGRRSIEWTRYLNSSAFKMLQPDWLWIYGNMLILRPFYLNYIGFQSTQEYNLKCYCSLLKLFTTWRLHTSKTSSKLNRSLHIVFDLILLEWPKRKMLVTLGGRSFYAAAPRLWNSLPLSIYVQLLLLKFLKNLSKRIFFNKVLITSLRNAGLYIWYHI